tara:strand:+ start:2999 stop:3649 length:651 start_codon:yes stop_codon:yes gene_type:complete
MRLIWKKRWGFVVISYPVEQDGGGFRVGVYDANGDLWWYSENTSEDNLILEQDACKGWLEILTDFGKRQEDFPDNSSVLENQRDIKAEIEVTRMRLSEIEAELKTREDGSNAGELESAITESNELDGRGSSKESEEQEKDQKVQASRLEENEADSGGSDSSGESERDESREDSGSESLDGEQSEEDDHSLTEERDTGHTEAPDQPEESDTEISTAS